MDIDAHRLEPIMSEKAREIRKAADMKNQTIGGRILIGFAGGLLFMRRRHQRRCHLDHRTSHAQTLMCFIGRKRMHRIL